MNGDGSGIVAGVPNHSHGRAFIPIISRSVHTYQNSAVISLEPLGIYVVDHQTEYYYPLRGDEPDFGNVERLAEILQKERERSRN
jgi:hypothetical protein